MPMDALPLLEFVRSGKMPETEFLCARNNTRLFDTVHANYAICITSRGDMTGRVRGRVVHAQGAGISLIEPGDTQVMHAVHESQDFNVLFVSPGVFLRAAEEQNLRGPVHFPFVQGLLQDPPLFRALKRLLDSVKAGESALEQQSRLAICLQGMLQHSERSFSPPKVSGSSMAVRQAIGYMQEHYPEPVGLTDLAALTGFSGYYLLHAFRDRTGLPPHAFLTRVRVEQARSLLARGLPPALVAVEVGFDDQSHLNRHFKQVLHLTPGEYAARSHRRMVCGFSPFSPASAPEP